MTAPTTRVLDARALGRATLERQLLLRRDATTAEAAVGHLVGMQAQAPFPPYTGLWTRVEGFTPADLADRLLDRSVVRVSLMRGTIHLVTASDCLALRPVVQPVLDRQFRANHARLLDGLDLAALVTAAREYVEEQPRSTADLGRRLSGRFPGRDRTALVAAAQTALPLLQVPPRAVWGRSGRATLTTADAWLGRPHANDAAPDAMVLRYLRAFGPATVADVQKWSGLTRLREVLERLRPGLAVFRDTDGAELFDLPDAPRPDPDTPAPVRFLPEFDNLLLAHADCRRIVAPARRPTLISVNGIVSATVLVDGTVRAVWKVARTRGSAVLEIVPFTALAARDAAAVRAEGAALLDFLAPDAGVRDVRIAAAGGN